MKEVKESREENTAPGVNYGWLFFDLLMIVAENLLALRIVLKFLGASTLNPLVSSFYMLTDLFVKFGLETFPLLTVSAEQSVFEGSTVLLFYLIYALHWLAQRRKDLEGEVVSGG